MEGAIATTHNARCSPGSPFLYRKTIKNTCFSYFFRIFASEYCNQQFIMQRKTGYLKRLLMIYIAFFALVAGSFLLEVMPAFDEGLSSGLELGEELNEAIREEQPKQIFMLWNIPIKRSEPIAITTANESQAVEGHLSTMSFAVTEPLNEQSPSQIAFAAIGDSPLIWLLMIASALCFPAIIVLMFFIIRSVRRSIREEETLGQGNAWMLRAIALLTICSELLGQVSQWQMNCRAAEVLRGSGYTIDTNFHLNFGMLIVGLLLLFSAEIFKIGRDLSEEQRLTI